MQLTELEAAKAALERGNKEFAHDNECLRDQATRTRATVASAVAVQEKLEAKYGKRTSERDAAREESKRALTQVAELQARDASLLQR